MEIIFNECSLHGQFNDVSSFENSLDILMEMRSTARKYDREIYCHRQLMHAMITNQLSLPQIIGSIDRNKASALKGWIGRTGPYWNEPRQHSSDEYFECREEVVTDTAIGECAYRQFLKCETQLTSISPSNWCNSPVQVIWHGDDQQNQIRNLVNHYTIETLETELKNFDSPIRSWDQMARACGLKFEALNFSEDTFSPLSGTPFVYAAAQSIMDLLSVLNEFKETHISDGGRSKKGDEMYQQYFTGTRAWYSDSSDREKIDFKNAMSFSHPVPGNEKIFAPYHGKVQTPQMRIHFSWPVTAANPLYVLYIGDKITKY
ncbi:hypothetical protein [Pseudomonas baetica]|uniref:hypothetical protein n=1 Tax=Pseudomonas baetica TaxID=674054 RepID=UPI0028716E02|nr:hypothetical protein [Pseudomonas baetica]MDR9865164.1 hypothetical protein [Pseudomonas baetica]